MPKNEIDYSNTIIYKITCNDSNVNDVYVGHTTNFVQRKYAHKQSCINNKSANYKCKLYEVIRANGGWNNWKMEIINFFECKDHYEARKKEQEYFVLLHANLNSIEPLPKPKVIIPKNKTVIEKEVFLCSICNIHYNNNKALEKHNKTNKHIKNNNGISTVIDSIAISADKYECFVCDITCCKKSDWDRHISTKKHLGNANGNTNSAEVTFTCKKCSKIYKSRKGLWGHNKKCNVSAHIENVFNKDIETTNNENVITPPDNKDNNHIIELLIKENTDIKNIMLEVVRSNADLQKQLVDACKHSNSNYNNTTNNINSHNKTFNLQFFLNEQCKDAMNMSEFVNSFDLQLSDLESVGDLGYVEGMTKIFLDKLNTMDIYKRPIHCSDTKREILYVKDEDKWEKEQRNNPKLRDAIKHLSFKNMKLTNLWSNTYPESKNNESRLNDVYMKLVLQSTGGSVESENKIIKKIAKNIFIDKNSIV